MKNSGVTLIELLITVSIIGILAVALGFEFQIEYEVPETLSGPDHTGPSHLLAAIIHRSLVCCMIKSHPSSDMQD